MIAKRSLETSRKQAGSLLLCYFAAALSFVSTTSAQNLFRTLPGSVGSSAPVSTTNGGFLRGAATHYGPFPDAPHFSEIGYMENDVGVGCSTGVPGGDPNWKSIISKGIRKNPLFNGTVWPMTPTVAVSEAAWGGPNKKNICWKEIVIRNAERPELQVKAVVVDFCPAAGCLWNTSERSRNVDIYGQATWYALGGGKESGKLQIEISWPPGLTPNPGLTIPNAASAPQTLLSVPLAVLVLLFCRCII